MSIYLVEFVKSICCNAVFVQSFRLIRFDAHCWWDSVRLIEQMVARNMDCINMNILCVCVCVFDVFVCMSFAAMWDVLTIAHSKLKIVIDQKKNTQIETGACKVQQEWRQNRVTFHLYWFTDNPTCRKHICSYKQI